MYTVYILECADGSLYCGITNNLKRRLTLHKAGKASAYTRSRGVKEVVYTEKRRTKGAALKREAQIKRLTRAEKLVLVGGELVMDVNDGWAWAVVTSSVLTGAWTPRLICK